jgi:hypothetical protein
MEHDVERIIQKKILETELQPVHWNKAGAWIKLQGQEKSKPLIPIYTYYAAAAISFSIMVGTFMMMRYNKSQLTKRINHLETLLQKAEATNMIKQNDTFLKPKCDGENKVFTNALPALTKSVTKKMRQTTIAIAKEDDTVPPALVETRDNKALQSEPIEPSPASIATATTIEPIIGLYDSTEKTESVTKIRKKNRVHWLRSAEFKSTEEITKNTILIARIK